MPMTTTMFTLGAGSGGGGGVSAELVSLLVILVAAAVAALLAHRVRLHVIPAYLVVGVLLGPGGLELVSNNESIATIESFALILLMFGIGLHLDLSAFRGSLVVLIGAGLLAVGLSVGLLTPLAMLFGLSVKVAVLVGMGLSLSSTAVVMRLLSERRLTRRTTSRLALGVLIVQDLAVVVMLAIVPALGGGEGGGGGGAPGPAGDPWYWMLAKGGLALLGVAVLVVVSRRVLPLVFGEAAKARSAEVLLVLSAAAALGAGAITSSLGFSPELGAFLAGFVLSTTPLKYEIMGQVAPVRDLFMAVFFTAVGLSVDPAALIDTWWIVGLALVALLSVKCLAITLASWSVGATLSVALGVGLILAQAGEFTLVVLAAGEQAGVLQERTMSVIIAVVVLSLVVTPAMLNLAARVGARLPAGLSAPWIKTPTLGEGPRAPGEGAGRGEDGEGGDGEAPAQRHVVIAGFGPVGRAVAERLTHRGVPYTVIELNPKTVRRQAELGRRVVFGDATNHEVLESARVGEACVVVLTMPDDDAMLRACRAVRTINPEVFIAARATYLSKAMVARGLGASEVIVEEVAAAETMDRLIARHLDDVGSEHAG